jgi:hypothetical protein
MEGVDRAPPEDVARDRGRVDEEVRDAGRVRFSRCRRAEHEPEPRSTGTEAGCRGHREIQLQGVRQQEDAVDGRAALEVDQPHRTELADEGPRPVVEHVVHPGVIGDPEGEIDVREAIAGIHRERSDDRAGDDAIVLPGELQDALAQLVALLEGEHGSRC